MNFIRYFKCFNCKPDSMDIIKSIYDLIFNPESDFESIEIVDNDNCFFITIEKIKEDCYNLLFKKQNEIVFNVSKITFQGELHLLDEKNKKCLKVKLPLIGIVKQVGEVPRICRTQS